MFKNAFLLIVSVTLGIAIIILGFLWVSPRNTQVLKMILPQSLFSLEKAPTDSLSGEIASISGKIAWQSRIAPVAILINASTKLQQGEEVDSYNDGNAAIDFPEVAVITISPNTQVNLIQTLPQNFVVWQKQGLANYEKSGENPVSVIALDLLINVESGASCSILLDKENARVTVTVKTGSVTAAFNDSDNNTNVVLVKSVHEYIFDDNSKTGRIKTL
jgi:hypothetical protein